MVEGKITDTNKIWQLKAKTGRGYPDTAELRAGQIVRQFSEGRVGWSWKAGEQFVSSGGANSELKMWLCREICLWWRLMQTTATIGARLCTFANRRVTAQETIQSRLP